MPASSGDQVIEFSVEETNKLREQLGLAPLRTGSNTAETATAAAAATGGDEVLQMSVDESNALRAQLGLPPLRGSQQSITKDQHAPAVNEGERKATATRIETARLKRQVQQGAAQYGQASLGTTEAETSALSFAEQMRQSKKAKAKRGKKGSKAKETSGTDTAATYGEEDVKGLTVGHSLGDFQEGSTTVLTLADTEILTADEASKRATGLNQDEAQLENVNLAEQATLQEGLRAKRKMEMGMGHAGGYAGFDDDEFEELGGTQGPSRSARGAALGDEKGKKRKVRGFQIGAMLDEQDEEAESDLFAAQSGKAISLQPTQADRTMSDFMTAEEGAELRPKKEKKKKKTKDKEFKKKKKHKDKKERTRRLESDDDEEDPPTIIPSKKKSLADELEETAVPVVGRKRRREEEEENEDTDSAVKKEGADRESLQDKRAKFEAVMEKGNERTRAAFSKAKRPISTDADEEPDDAFLNAALAKARRLNRLKQLSTKDSRGADAVAQAVEQSSKIEPESAVSGGGGIKFSIDDTREFTLALRAKKEQEQRDRAKKEAAKDKDATSKAEKKTSAVAIKSEEEEEKPQAETVDEDNDVDMKELAKEVKEDDPTGTDLLGGETPAVARGLGGVMQMLRQTGELTRKNAGREEMRGRAKDERTYEDYEALDLSKVVRIDERNATSKDREFASREVKLEYRDEHGRLLTRKEAFREMSYQFHGYGSGKRKQEKKMKQIAREQAEQRVASQQANADGGMLGALKATQKATGKAFVVHKT